MGGVLIESCVLCECASHVIFTSMCYSSFESPTHTHLPLLVPRPAVSDCASSLPTHRCGEGRVEDAPLEAKPRWWSHKTIPEIWLNLHLRVGLPRGDVGTGGGISASGQGEDRAKRWRIAVAQLRWWRWGSGNQNVAVATTRVLFLCVEMDQLLPVCLLILHGSKPEVGWGIITHLSPHKCRQTHKAALAMKRVNKKARLWRFNCFTDKTLTVMALSYPLITNLQSHTRAQNAALNPGD